MGVPRQRKTHSERNQRRSHHALSRIQTAKCQNCGAAVMPHDICGNCGFYRGTEIVSKPVVSKTTK